METWTQTCGPYPGGLILTHTHVAAHVPPPVFLPVHPGAHGAPCESAFDLTPSYGVLQPGERKPGRPIGEADLESLAGAVEEEGYSDPCL